MSLQKRLCKDYQSKEKHTPNINQKQSKTYLETMFLLFLSNMARLPVPGPPQGPPDGMITILTWPRLSVQTAVQTYRMIQDDSQVDAMKNM